MEWKLWAVMCRLNGHGSIVNVPSFVFYVILSFCRPQDITETSSTIVIVSNTASSHLVRNTVIITDGQDLSIIILPLLSHNASEMQLLIDSHTKG